MSRVITSVLVDPNNQTSWDQGNRAKLLQGDLLIQTQSHSLWGGAVTAQMYLPLGRSQVWQQVTDYPRWVHYFPDVVQSEILSRGEGLANEGNPGKYKRLYQVASKAFFLFTAQVEIYLKVFETVQATWQQIQFQLERGSFADFTASLKLQDLQSGTLLTYSVQATPTIPVPTQFVQQAMRLDLPTNMEKMRQVICGQSARRW